MLFLSYKISLLFSNNINYCKLFPFSSQILKEFHYKEPKIYTIKKTASGFVEQTAQVSAILFYVEYALINVYEKFVFLFRQCAFIRKKKGKRPWKHGESPRSKNRTERSKTRKSENPDKF